MKPEKIANRDCRSYVQKRKPFDGSNMWGAWIPSTVTKGEHHYTVFSYGHHFPVFIYAGGRWFENEDRYSQTTSKHRSQAHPHTDTVKLNTDIMCRLSTVGITRLNQMRVLGDIA